MIANLFKIEFLKILYSRSLKFVGIFSLVAILLVRSQYTPIENGSGLETIEHFFDSIGNAILAVVVTTIWIMVMCVMVNSVAIAETCNEFSSNMFKQQIMMGISREKLLLGRAISNLYYSIFYTLVLILCMLIFNLDGYRFILEIFLSIFFVLTVATTFAFIIPRTGVAIALFIGYFFLEFVILGIAKNELLAQLSTKTFIQLFALKTDTNFDAPLNPYLSFFMVMAAMFFIQYRLIKNKSF